MSERWPPMLGVVGFDGGYRSAVALAIPPEELLTEEGFLGGEPEGTGACCNGDSSCTDGVTQFDCTSSGGIYQGDGTDCASVDCGTPSGACCIGSDCTIETESDCTGMGGTYQGDGTVCDPNPCGGCDCSAATHIDVSITLDFHCVWVGGGDCTETFAATSLDSCSAALPDLCLTNGGCGGTVSGVSTTCTDSGADCDNGSYGVTGTWNWTITVSSTSISLDANFNACCEVTCVPNDQCGADAINSTGFACVPGVYVVVATTAGITATATVTIS